MSDITPLLAELLKRHEACLKRSPRRASDTEDKFLQEAYRINAHISSLHAYLLSIRRPYLSTSSPPRRPLHPQTPSPAPTILTNPQRDQIDTETKSLLSSLAASIQQLVIAERLRQDTDREVLRRKRGGAFRRWANGNMKDPEQEDEEGKIKTTGAWRESVVWYLGRKLEGAGEVQRGMVETRVERELEKSRSVLYKSHGGRGGHAATKSEGGGGSEDATALLAKRGDFGTEGLLLNGGGINPQSWTPAPLAASDLAEIESQLTSEQLQLFAQENADLLSQYSDTLSQVRTAQSSLLEISSLQTTLAQNLDVQSAHIQQLVTDSVNTEENVVGGNTQLKRAIERRSVARDVFWATVGLCAGLVVWDLVF